MACRIERNINGGIHKVYAPNGNESKLYSDLKNFIKDYKSDEYIDKVLSEDKIKNRSTDEIALALWSKTYTKEFKNWFKDSKIVDENGEPLLVIHKTNEKFEEFSSKYFDEETRKILGAGLFFSDKPLDHIDGNITMPVFLQSGNIKGSLEEFDNDSVGKYKTENPNTTYLKGKDFGQKSDGNVYVVFEQDQVKSIFNKGNFTDSPNIYLNLDAPKAINSAELQESLFSLMDKMGYNIQSIKEYKNEYNLRTGRHFNTDGINGILDGLNKTVALKDGNDGVLTEEVAHLAIEHLRDTKTFNRALSQITKTHYYNNYSQQYRDKYKEMNPELRVPELEYKVQKELAGKFLADILVRKHTKKETGSRLYTLLMSLWNKFKSFITGSTDLKNFLEATADKIQNKDYSNFNADIQSEDTLLSLAEEDYTDLKRAMRVASNSMKDRLKRLKQRSNLTKTDKLRKRLEDNISELENLILESRYEEGLIKFFEHLKEDRKTAINYIKKVKNDEDTVNAHKIEQLTEFISYYSPNIEQLSTIVRFTPEFKTIKKKDLKKLRKTIEKEETHFTTIRSFRDRANIKEFKNYMEPVVKKYNEEGIEYDLNENANNTSKDSAWYNFFFGQAASNIDPIVRKVHEDVVNIKNKIFRDSVDFGRDIITKINELGFQDSNLEFALERDSKGNKTGNYINIIHRQKFENARNTFSESLRKKYNLSSDRVLQHEQKNNWSESTKNAYNKEWGKWLNENTTVKENAKDIIKERKEYFTDSEGVLKAGWYAWKEANITEWTSKSGKSFTFYKGELVEPSRGGTKKRTSYDTSGKKITKEIKLADYTNYEYTKLSDNQKQLADLLTNTKVDIDKKLIKSVPAGRVPQITESLLDIFKGSRPNLFKRLRRYAGEEFGIAPDDTQYGEQELSTIRPDGTRSRFVPTYYTSKLDDPNSVSNDLVSGLIAYYDMATNFEEFNKQSSIFEVVLRQVGSRTYTNDNETKLGKETNVYKTLEKFLDMNVYGIRHENSGKWKIPGTNIEVSKDKVARKLTSFVRHINLIGKLFTVVSGFVAGSTYSIIEDLVGRYTTKKGALWANSEFFKNVHHAALEMGNPIKTNKMHLFFEQLGITDGVTDLFDNLDIDKRLKAISENTFYGSYSLADYKMKGSLALSIAHNYRNYKGKYYTKTQFDRLKSKTDYYSLPNVYDEITVKDGKLVYPKHLTEDTLNHLRNKTGFLASKIDGVLRDTDKAAVHQSTIGQFFTTHRGWLFRGVTDRFKSKGYNHMTGEVDSGYYNTTFNLLSRLIRSNNKIEKLRNKAAGWNKLEPHEQYAVLRTAYEFAFTLALATTAVIINNIASESDDEDDYLLQVAAYLSNRTLLELGAFVPPQSFFEITSTLNAPIVSMRQVEMVMDVMELFDNDVLQSGPYEGMTKRKKTLIKLTPGLNGFYSLRSPESSNQFLKSKPLDFIY